MYLRGMKEVVAGAGRDMWGLKESVKELNRVGFWILKKYPGRSELYNMSIAWSSEGFLLCSSEGD